jgi:2-keto-4-pentenoate hydratase/2-oxohepta-3-ene-1,7-dioic acid hydratase in catechol pathway
VKLVRFDGGHIGIVQGDQVADLTGALGVDPAAWPPVSMVQLIADFAAKRPVLERAIGSAKHKPLSAVHLDTPVPWPNKLIAFPANYHKHAQEMASTYRASSRGFFLKANSCLVGASDKIVLPDMPLRMDHECELAIIIGREGRQIPAERAFDHIFGYSCLVDVTVRGQQERVMRKSYDTFCPVGPWIVTADEVPDATRLGMKLWVNGEVRQDANTRDLVVDIPGMIVMASSAMTLYPGDIIATGTPEGVGPINPGDTVSIEIDHVGRMDLAVVRGQGGWNSAFAEAESA